MAKVHFFLKQRGNLHSAYMYNLVQSLRISSFVNQIELKPLPDLLKPADCPGYVGTGSERLKHFVANRRIGNTVVINLDQFQVTGKRRFDCFRVAQIQSNLMQLSFFFKLRIFDILLSGEKIGSRSSERRSGLPGKFRSDGILVNAVVPVIQKI